MTCPQPTFSKKTKNDHNLVSSHQKKITHFIQDSFPIRWGWGVVRGWFSDGSFSIKKKKMLCLSIPHPPCKLDLLSTFFSPCNKKKKEQEKLGLSCAKLRANLA